MNTASIASDASATLRIDRRTPDDALMTAALAGDRAALGFLYLRHADALRTAAVRALPAHEEPEADDLVQEVFLALLERRTGDFQPARGRALAWLKGIVRRQALARAAPIPQAASSPRAVDRIADPEKRGRS